MVHFPVMDLRYRADILMDCVLSPINWGIFKCQDWLPEESRGYLNPKWFDLYLHELQHHCLSRNGGCVGMHPVGEVYLELNGPDSTVVSGHTPWHETEVEIVVEVGTGGGFPRKDRCRVHCANSALKRPYTKVLRTTDSWEPLWKPITIHIHADIGYYINITKLPRYQWCQC